MFAKTIRDYHERRAALAKRKTEITVAAAVKARDLQRELGKSNARATADIEAADADERAASQALERELVQSAHDTFAPLVGQWCAEPGRGLALKIGQQLAALVDRERVELGDSSTPRAVKVLGFAFIDRALEARPQSVRSFATDDTALVEPLGAVLRALSLPLELEPALRGLERAVERRAAREVDVEVQPAAERYAALRMLDVEAVKAVDDRLAKLAREKSERDGAAYKAEQDALGRGQQQRQGSTVA